MAKITERERIATLEAKLEQLKTVQARARSVAAKRSRGEELRRKILVGAVVLAKVEDGTLEEAVLKEWLAPVITKPADRALFDLCA